MDTRAWRLALPSGVKFFELDRPALVAYKSTQMQREPLPGGVTRQALAVDLRDDWTSTLRGAGFDPSAPALWIAEGLWFFLTENQARQVLLTMRELSAPGSRLITDLASASTLTNPFARRFLNTLAEDGAPWQFGTDVPDEFLASSGWAGAHIRQPGQSGAQYDRWDRPVPEEKIKAPRWFLCVASTEQAAPIDRTAFQRKVVDTAAGLS
jgi:methyltransferase (TIGR00027 family)